MRQPMGIPFWVEKRFHQAVDLLYANRPQPFPDKERLKQCKIISHRGEHDNKTIFENTIAAFDHARDAGVWGIEFDVRWTKDLQPVVFHDKNLQRLFQSGLEVNTVTLSELKSHCKLIPSLSEVIQRYGNKLHLMVEIKEETYPDPVIQNRILRAHFNGLSPQDDFHFLSLTPEMFTLIDCVPETAFLPIARLNVKKLSETALLKNYRGVTGHYLFITNTIVKKHLQQGQHVGTGHIPSQHCLFRELNRGVEWIFSNHAAELQNICNSLLKIK